MRNYKTAVVGTGECEIIFSLLQMILFQTARHQEVITVVVVLGTTWLVMQGWFIRAIEKFKIA